MSYRNLQDADVQKLSGEEPRVAHTLRALMGVGERSEEELTNVEIATLLGVTRQFVSLVEQATLRFLRDYAKNALLPGGRRARVAALSRREPVREQTQGREREERRAALARLIERENKRLAEAGLRILQ